MRRHIVRLGGQGLVERLEKATLGSDPHTEEIANTRRVHWFVVQTKVGKETLAQKNLVHQEFETFYPTIQKQVRHARKVLWRRKALFPGYLFVGIDPARQSCFSINSTYGVSKLVGFGGRPAQLPRDFIENMRRWTREDGTIDAPPDLHAGARVRVISGAFDNWVGDVIALPDRDRATLLIDMLSRKVPITLDRNKLLKL